MRAPLTPPHLTSLPLGSPVASAPALVTDGQKRQSAGTEGALVTGARPGEAWRRGRGRQGREGAK